MLKSIMFGIVLTLSLNSFGGGSSVAGPGAPRFEYGCIDAVQSLKEAPSFEANIVRVWPKYELELTIIDRDNSLVVSESTEQKRTASIGGPLQFISPTFQIEMNFTVSPILEGGRSFVPGTLYQGKTIYRQLKCEFLGE